MFIESMRCWPPKSTTATFSGPQKRYFRGVLKVYFHSSFTLERNQRAALEALFHLPHLFLLPHPAPHQKVLFLKASLAFRCRHPAFHLAVQSETLPAAFFRPPREVRARSRPALICNEVIFLIIVDGQNFIFDMDISYTHDAVLFIVYPVQENLEMVKRSFICSVILHFLSFDKSFIWNLKANIQN